MKQKYLFPLLLFSHTLLATNSYNITYLNEDGELSEITTCTLKREYSHDQILLDTLYENSNFERQTQYSYDDEGRLSAIDSFDRDGQCDSQTYTYDQIDHSAPLSTSPASWEEWVKETAYAFAQNLKEFKNQFSYSRYMEKEWNQTAERFFGKGFLQFSGYYPEQIDSGCTPYGKEINDHVRVTLINGILNIRSDLDVLLKIFSHSHGDIPIHYVYRPTEGWTKDLLTSTQSKLGFITPYAALLAETWKSMIQEMGGVGQGGKIIHYAHSIGATDTYVAKELMTPEEQQMIHVITLGSPTMIPNNSGFGSAVNYASRRDGVCLLDPIGYAMGQLYGTSRIELIGSFWGIPLIDHTLYTDSYGLLIEDLGAKFTESYRNEL